MNPKSKKNTNFSFGKLAIPITLFTVSIILKLIIYQNNSNNNSVSINETGKDSQLNITQHNTSINSGSSLEIIFYCVLALAVLSALYFFIKNTSSNKKENIIKIFLFLFVLPSICFSQTKNSVYLNKTGDNSKVVIVQNGDFKSYNLNDKKEFTELLKYLSNMSGEFKELFDNIQKGQAIQYKELRSTGKKLTKSQNDIKQKLNDLPKSILTALLTDSSSMDILKLEIKIRELESSKLSLENALKDNIQRNPDFSIILDSASKTLAQYDFAAYHQIMEAFIEKSINNAANGCYLRSETYKVYFQYQDAFSQIERAYMLDSSSKLYLEQCVHLSMLAKKKDKEIYYLLKLSLRNDLTNFDKNNVFSLLGAVYEKINIDSSLSYYSKAEKNSLNELKTDSIYSLYILIVTKASIGGLKLRMGRNTEALIDFQTAISLSHSCPRNTAVTKFWQAIAYRHIGTSYEYIESSDSAIKYYTLALQSYEDFNPTRDYQSEASITYNIAGDYYTLKLYDSSLLYFQKTIGIYEKLNENLNPTVGITLSLIGYTYLQIDNKALAKEYFQKASIILVNYPDHSNTYQNVKKQLAAL